MIIIRNIKVDLDGDFSDIKGLLERVLKVGLPKIATVKLFKKGVDARRRDAVHFNCAFLVESPDEKGLLKALKRFKPEPFLEAKYDWKTALKSKKRPVVIGFGPAGMFAALSLAKAGLCPLVLERGKDADSRKRDVDAFWNGGSLDENSNVQFGEGGAGTFSDGKLNTGIKDPRIREVLRVFAVHGAGERILYDAKPHIGTDVLVEVVKSIRREIINCGGEVLFEHRVVGFESKNGRLLGLNICAPEGDKFIETDHCVLAVGHSARDTFEKVKTEGIALEPKPFAIGARIEHLQADINRSQYGKFADHPNLGAADYKLACHLENGRGVFTFCMCPGGVVVNASSEQDGIAVNGMSYSKRDGVNSNAALLVGVGVEDYYKGDVLDGMYFQREIERKAFIEGKGRPVSQTVGDFLKRGNSGSTVTPTVNPKTAFGNIDNVLPGFVTEAMREGIVLLDRRLKGFGSSGAVLTAPETRSSSPVRILRNDKGESSLRGLYPCGEGAGYAGGITSAAVDGLKTAEQIINAVSREI
ncbi:MAG: hypothetical protein E7525_01485 [Ruminococcaceae bacterium]|nr:hypothetical protein [Oscillospiraceae bacterium]